MLESFSSKFKTNLLKLLSESLPDEDKSYAGDGKSPGFLLAVSGGADSVSLLALCAEVLPVIGARLVVATVNHNLRPPEETCGDADFVEALCEKFNLACRRIELSGAQIRDYAKTQACGLEAAARRFRYDALEKCRVQESCDFILTAHNQDDYFETIIMRIFQGGNPESLAGLRAINGLILRPLLGFSRSEIIAYLASKKLSFREDSTNSNLSFLRNRVRLTLVPALNETFPNWRKSLNKTIKKIAEECKAVEILASGKTQGDGFQVKAQAPVIAQKKCGAFLDLAPHNHAAPKEPNCKIVRIDGIFFRNSVRAVRRRLLQAAFSRLGVVRVSHEFTEQCLSLGPGKRCELKNVVVRFRRKELLVELKED